MPYKWVPPAVLLTHGAVTVYRVYKNDDADGSVRHYWYTTNVLGGDGDAHGENGAFDVREFCPGQPCETHEEIVAAITAAIDAGRLTAYEEDESDA